MYNKHYSTVDIDPVLDDSVTAAVPAIASTIDNQIAVRTISQVAPDVTEEEASPIANEPFMNSHDDLNETDHSSASSEEIRPAEKISNDEHVAIAETPVEQASNYEVPPLLPVVTENRDEIVDLWSVADATDENVGEAKLPQNSDVLFDLGVKEEKLDDILADVALHGAEASQALWVASDAETHQASIAVSADSPRLSIQKQTEARTDIFFDGDDIFASSRVTTAQSKPTSSFDALFMPSSGVEPRTRSLTEELFFGGDVPISSSVPLELPGVASKEVPALRLASQAHTAAATNASTAAATTTRTATQMLSSPFNDNIFTEADDIFFAPLQGAARATDAWTFDAPKTSDIASPAKEKTQPDISVDPLADFQRDDPFSLFAGDINSIVKPRDLSTDIDPWGFDLALAGENSNMPNVAKHSDPLAPFFDDATTESASFDVGSAPPRTSPTSAPAVDSDEWFIEAPATKSGKKRHGHSAAARLREENLSRIAKTYGVATSSPRSVESRTGPLSRSPRDDESPHVLHSLTFAAGSFNGSPFFDPPSIDVSSSPDSQDRRESPGGASAATTASGKRPSDLQPRRLSSMNDLREELNLRRMREEEVKEARRRMQEQLLAIQQAKQDYPPKQGNRK
jgi:hypothetical protein